MDDSTVLLPYVKLRLNVDHPNYEESYLLGYESALADIEEQDNPYREGTQAYAQWVEGWWVGFYEEAPLFTASEDLNDQEEGCSLAANDQCYHGSFSDFVTKFLNITSALTATVVIGYQLFDLVA